MPSERQTLALRWIVGLLDDLDVPFQAVGGLAARAYGADRPLADLDFYVPIGRLQEIAAAATTHVVRPPAAHSDDAWDLTFTKLEYEGCEIELAGAEGARYFDRRGGCWRPADIDFTRSVERMILGVQVPTMPRGELIAYKRALDREVDGQDIVAMAGTT